MFKLLIKCVLAGMVTGGAIASLQGREYMADWGDTWAFWGAVTGVVLSLVLRYGCSPTVRAARAMQRGDEAATLMYWLGRGAMEEIPHRLSSPTGHGSATVAVSRRLLTEMYDEDVAVQSRRLELLLRDAAQAKRNDKGFMDCTTGTFVSHGSAVTTTLRVAHWRGTGDAVVLIGHDMA